MNRKERRAARVTGDVIDLGQVVVPVAGSIFWRDGKALGLWGRDFPLRCMILDGQGQPRDMTPAERRMARRMGCEVTP